MPPKTKKIKEDLAKRRLAQKMCKRRRYAEIKNDPQLLEIEKEKRRERYQRQKQANKELSPRALREQRQKWRENSKRYRQNKKKEPEKKKFAFEMINVHSVTGDQSNSNLTVPEMPEDPLPHDPGTQAAVRKFRYTELKKRKWLMRIIAAYKKRDKTQRKLIQRLKTKIIETRTEQTFHEPQLEFESDGITSEEEETSNIIERVKKFYTEDTNSVIRAGKKEFITRNKFRKQKRYLCLPLKELYKKFISETSLRISYSFFCKLRPFRVLFPKNMNRETCGCTLHVNMELMISALNKASILKEKNSAQVLSSLCCDSKNINCLQRNCNACRQNHLVYNKEFGNRNLTYFQWVKVTKDITLNNGTKKKQLQIEKRNIKASSTELIEKIETDLINFLQHTYKIVGQYKSISNLKENLKILEALVHVDFSENYNLKYAEEVQPFHYGSSRQQVTIHTAVIYTHDFSTGKVTPKSMCTISECLRHDAAAIWAHLVPLLEEVIKCNPLIDTIHFLSDSPSSQYRNKYLFYIITQICKDFPQLNNITWNYSESGHGKGAPDGVGATLKRTADRMVVFGEDVGTFDQFYNLITRYIEKEQLKVIVRRVEGKDVLLKSSLIPVDLKTFKGTLSVHQVLWDRSKTRVTLRTMSCFECLASEICMHTKHLGYMEMKVPVSQKLKILSDITLKAANTEQFEPKPSTSKNYTYFV